MHVSTLAIARRLGISAQALNSTFKAADVKSGTIEKIAEVIGVKMSFFYPMESGSAVASGDGSVANVSGNVTMGDNTALLQERIAMLERLLEEKERTIKILMER